MPYLKAASSKRLPLPSDPDYWVEMKERASHGDKKAAQTAMLKVTSVDLLSVDPAKADQVIADMESGRGVLTEIETAAFFDVLLVRLITDWNLDGPDGLLPITAATIAQLDPDDGAFLEAEARKRLGTRAVAQEAPFDSRSPQPSSATRSNSRMPSRR